MLRGTVYAHTTLIRFLHSSARNYEKARTYESKPIPGSEEHVKPLKWAERLFKLKELPDPPAKQPPLLHMICRVKPCLGVPHYQRAILEKYTIGQDVQCHTWVPVKNTPSVNKELAVIKHLIRVQPIEFPQGLPDSETDLRNCVLRPNGNFYLRKAQKLTVNEQSLPKLEEGSSLEELVKNIYSEDVEVKKMQVDRVYLKKHFNKNWSRSRLFCDMFSAKYRYKLNQDGQEYRYSKLWKNEEALKHSVRNRKNSDGTLKAQQNFDADWNTYPWSSY
ncbi:39S ribosomal protein L30, mitochondrial [Cichlidogyrus casuarinus]|uniref:39S ribosomal protein L30, mitochondrial n=1 Tax=Cichlidogyrus casuarinus TaxID=1844966 RepID=A0ABD2Q6I5_9PLAT